MCKCGCNTCETKTKGPLLTEGKVKSLLSEGLQYHIDKKIPLFETVYRIGSDKHLALIKEARKMYSRNVIDLCEDDEALIGTHLGEFGLYEGESVPLDLPMLDESDSNYPDFDLNKNIRYQDTVITNGMWRYTGRESGGAGVYRNLNNDQFLAFDRNDFDIFRKNLSSHFDFSESLNENEDKLLKIKQELEALRPGTISWIDDIFISSYDGSLQVELDYTLYPDEIKQLAQIAAKYGMELKYMTGKNATLVKRIDEAVKNALTDKNDKRTHNESKIPTQDQVDKFFVLTQNEKHYLNSKPVAGQEKTFNKMEVEPWDEYDLSNWNSLVRKAKSKGQLNEGEIEEAEFKGKDVPLNKPKRGGSKAYYVYVRDPKTKKIKKVSFGSGGLRAKIKNKEARNAFAARHNCKNKKDRTKAGYWSCNLPRYAPALGLGAKMNTFW